MSLSIYKDTRQDWRVVGVLLLPSMLGVCVYHLGRYRVVYEGGGLT